MEIRMRSAARFLVLALTVLVVLPFIAQAQDDYDDPPTRVARLSYATGSVTFQPAGTEDWVDATINRPMTTGDSLWSDSGSRAALHIGSASIAIGENTNFSFLNLTDNTAQMQLTMGTIRVRVKRLGDNENFEIDTPNLAFTVLRPGIYKISVTPDGATTAIEDRAGEGEATGGGAAYTTQPGEFDTFMGTDQVSVSTDSIYDNDDEFEQWCERRDHHEDNSPSMRYVSDDVIGYDDLDDNGGWRQDPNYGYVWYPHTTIVGWAPYHYGHWSYVAPWGYTWVDDAPWGFAPFHYGRWVSVNGSWGWVPAPPRPYGYVSGPAYVRPVYAPALVAWVGGVGGAGVAWFALGPREVYMPSYPVSRNYATRINVSNTRVDTTVVNNYYTTVVVNKTVNVTNVTYVNQRVAGAVVATSPQAFSSGQSVSKNVVRVDERTVATAQVNVIAPAAVPQREAVLGGRQVVNVRPPAAVQTRAIVAKTAPPPPPPTFQQRQAAIQTNGGRPLSVAQVRQIAPAPRPAMVAARVKVEPKAAAPAPMKAAPAAGAGANAQRPANNNMNRPAPNATTPAPAANARPENPPAARAPETAPANAQRPANPPPAPAPNAQRSVAASPAPAPAANVNRAPTAHPMDEQLEQKHQQENVDMHQKQDQERQQLEQKQQQDNQKLAQQKANAAKQQQAAQQHQQELEALQAKHQQEQQQLQQKQEQEHKQAAASDPKKDKPAPPKNDTQPK